MRFLLKTIRTTLGLLFVLVDFIFSPRKIKRTTTAQQQLDQKSQNFGLYHFYACPFCIKTRRAIKRLNLNIKTYSAQAEPHRAELLAGGGKIQVPCLKIQKDDEVEWLHESDNIIKFLEDFASA